MDITKLKKQIEDSSVSNVTKKEILEMIDKEGEYSEELIQKIKKFLDGTAEDLIEQIANLQIQDATDEFGEQMVILEKEVNEFGKEINQKVNDIDLANVKSSLGIE